MPPLISYCLWRRGEDVEPFALAQASLDPKPKFGMHADGCMPVAVNACNHMAAALIANSRHQRPQQNRTDAASGNLRMYENINQAGPSGTQLQGIPMREPEIGDGYPGKVADAPVVLQNEAAISLPASSPVCRHSIVRRCPEGCVSYRQSLPGSLSSSRGGR